MVYLSRVDNMNRDFCASAFIVDPVTKKILLVKHRKYNKWVQPGGHIMENESPEEAAVREAYEETNIKVRLIGDRFPRESDFIRPLGIQKNNGINVQHIDIIYPAVPVNDIKYNYDPNESTNIGWFSREELDNIDVFPDIKITMDYILQNIIK